MKNEDFTDARILIVDDKEANIEILSDLLEMEDYRNVKTISDSRKVMSLVKRWRPELILLDLMMPFYSGFDILRMVKETLSEHEFLPILVLTADISEETKQRALAEGATDFLFKPFELVEVSLRIRNLLRSKFMFQQLLVQNEVLEEKVKERTVELKKKNDELNEAYQKMQASDRFKTIFINNISHEIRTPLNGILGFSQILTEDGIPKEDKDIYFEKIYESSNRLIKTITNYIDLSNLHAGSQRVIKKELQPNLLIYQVKDELLSISNKKQIPIIVDIPQESNFKFISDADILRKILGHLLDNAIKFTKEGEVLMGYERFSSVLRFFIKDSGVGIAEDRKEAIFESFVQEDEGSGRFFEGSGLGLTISKKFTELLGGKLWIDSEKNVGTAVYLEIPGIEIVEPTAVKAEEPKEKPERHTILVVEDDALNFLYVSHLLNNPNIEVIHANDGIEAVNHAMIHNNISLILMDLRMPKMDGFTATQKIKEAFPHIPIIAITAFSGVESEQKAHEAGCDDVLLKPVKQNVLYSKLAEYSIHLS